VDAAIGDRLDDAVLDVAEDGEGAGPRFYVSASDHRTWCAQLGEADAAPGPTC
jgi:hypothetical protein